VDVLRDKFDVPATVEHIKYDSNRSADIALVHYADGEKRHVLAPRNLNVGDRIVSLNGAPRVFSVGMSLLVGLIPVNAFVHCIELEPGRGAAIARRAGSGAKLESLTVVMRPLKCRAGRPAYSMQNVAGRLATSAIVIMASNLWEKPAEIAG
jgi:large subunit ribosomal protein L2